MSGVVEVVEAGLGNCIQDAGRPGYRSIGVPLSGAADRILLACANRLAGNEAEQAAIEVNLVGPRLKAVSGIVRIGIAGNVAAHVTGSNGSAADIPAWRTTTLFPGDVIAIGATRGPAYVSVCGGFRVPRQLGSRSTYARARIGGMAGRALAPGDSLPCGEVRGDPWLEFRAAAPFVHAAGPIRIIPGPQDDYFDPAAFDALLGEEFTVSRDADRMGMRLDGPALAHRADKGADIVSDGIVPGAIQVPADGRAIILLADAQTVGGYPKIATVIAADLPRLAHLAPGAGLRFQCVSLADARAARLAQEHALAAWCERIASFRPPGVIDEAALFSENLISGMIDAHAYRCAADIDLPWEK
ncbi:MAG: biotin-dependent carboxyltransferase family protein [Defluviicoccus sp.]|nr:biotin-dependent carboxyltransferase family protein [Defluviicoccus sp.]